MNDNKINKSVDDNTVKKKRVHKSRPDNLNADKPVRKKNVEEDALVSNSTKSSTVRKASTNKKPTGDKRPSNVEKPTGDKRPSNVEKPTGDKRPSDVEKPTGDKKTSTVKKSKKRKPIDRNDSKKSVEEKTINWKLHVPFYVIESILLIVVIIGTIFIGNATRAEKVNLDTSKIMYNDNSSNDNNISENQVVEEVLSYEDIIDTSNDVISDREGEAVEEIVVDKDAIQKELYEKYNGIFNMAFFGVDSREGDLGAGTRSDSMIICSIDMNTHEVKLISIFRDTYLNLGNGSFNKCNSAYAIGGPEQALSMINMNTDIYVDQYVTVGFEGLVEAIDALGGVPVTVEENEIFHLNNYQKTMAEQLGVQYTPVLFAGTQMLNGLQATAYCRIRYTKGNDFKRAERQRTVIAAMMERAGKVSLSSLTAAITKILPNVSTSLSLNDLTSMMSLVGDYKVTVSDGFPFEGMRTAGNIGAKGSCVIPTDLVSNVKKLHMLLYGEENYGVTSAIQQYSVKIHEDTAPYLE